MVNERDVMFWMISSSVFSKPLSEMQKKYINADILNQAFNLALEHSTPHLFLPALRQNALTELCPEILPKAQKAVYFANVNTTLQMEELKKLSFFFEKNRIQFIVLKGAVLRELYPEPWMRIGCDIDILVKKGDFNNACKLIAEKLNYTIGKVTSRDVAITAPNGVHIELHFKLINRRAAASENVLQRVWEESTPKYENSFEHVMSDEMFYLFHIAHAAKHFEEGGCGLRPLLDLCFLNQIDNPKRKEILKEAGLEKFAEILSVITRERFGKEFANMDELTKKAEDFIIAGRTYGTVKTSAITTAIYDGKIEKIRTLLFPDYDKMSLLFPVLKKHKLLLPFLWVYRWFNAVFEGRARISKDRLKIASKITQESIDEAAKLLNDMELI
ncbi:MAG: nucleotidyltransferase family protein [Clostridiales bacterium]|nr:nucleotidyltransferase family protein [Candidatus Equinaster intestinalis]